MAHAAPRASGNRGAHTNNRQPLLRSGGCDRERSDPDGRPSLWLAAGVSPHSRWRYVPSASAAMLLVLVILTWGAAVLLAPIGIALTIMALKRVFNWRHPLVVLGVVGNGLFAATFLATLVTLAYDAVVT